MLPAGVETRTPSETKFLIIVFELFEIDNDAACLLCLKIETSFIAIDFFIRFDFVLTVISKGEIVTTLKDFDRFLIVYLVSIIQLKRCLNIQNMLGSHKKLKILK